MSPNHVPFQTPGDDIAGLVNAPPTPVTSISPDRSHVLHLHYNALPSLRVLAEPWIKLAGVRFIPDTNTLRQIHEFTHLEIQSIATGRSRTVPWPRSCNRLGAVAWSPDGQRIAFSGTDRRGLKLWVYDLRTRRTHKVVDAPMADTVAGAFRWLSSSDALLVTLVPEGRGPAPEKPLTPPGPVTQETTDRVAQNRTWQDLLEGPHDEALFEYYMNVQMARVDVNTRALDLIGAPALLRRISPSPDGQLLLIQVMRPPWSYDVPCSLFAHRLEVWDLEGNVVCPLADLDVADDIPIEGVSRGPRRAGWQPTRAATLLWAEALDEGDPRQKVEHRERVMRFAAPFVGAPEEVTRLRERLTQFVWLERDDQALVSEYDRDRRWVTTNLLDLSGATPPRLIFDRSARDVYGDPGSPAGRTLPNGFTVAELDGDWLWLVGSGATPDGYRPFIDRLNLTTLESVRTFQADLDAFSRPMGFGPELNGHRLIVMRRESPTEPPNYFVAGPPGPWRPLTRYADPHPWLTGIQQHLLKYTRADGVPLSGTLYLPPTWAPGQRIPLVVWAYPLEYNDAQTAGQIRAAPNTFTRLAGTSPLMFLARGYAVLYDATMPIVGDPETMNDTFVEQLRDSARAAIDACVDFGAADRERVAIAGHSYGAFMAVNLLAHTELFRAGIARSGAYNRTLTPFGFQSERRTLWEAPDSYVRLSPIFQADKIKAPLLLIHGADDNNPGTFPLQSRRLFHALRGLGATARLVLLPHESHGYQARESILHVLAESFDWLDRYVKGG